MSKFPFNWLRRSRHSTTDKDAWQQRITPLERRAFELATVRWKSGAPLDEATLAEALRLQKDLRSIADELRQHHPDIYSTFSSTISEALLDYKYAISAPLGTSLRLHHYIENQESKG